MELTRTSEGPASARDAGADVHGDAADVGAQQLDLAGVAAGAHLEAERLHRLADRLAHFTARAGPSKVARKPSPVRVDLGAAVAGEHRAQRPGGGARAARVHLRSPSSQALSVEPTMSVKRTVASMRSRLASSSCDRLDEVIIASA